MINNAEILKKPRVIVVQKLYSYNLNKDQEILYPKHRYKKFIKDIVTGTIERDALINDIINKELKNDLNPLRTDILLKIIIMAAIYELLYKPQTSINIIINEYIETSQYFLSDNQKKYLNAILDKLSTKVRNG